MIQGTKIDSSNLASSITEIIEGYGVMDLYSQAGVSLGYDLVVFCDLASEQVGVMSREEFIGDSEEDLSMWDMMSGPAVDSLPKDTLNQLGFWLIVALNEDEVYCTAVGAYVIGPGGEA